VRQSRSVVFSGDSGYPAAAETVAFDFSFAKKACKISGG
jgi:hypothetical protein